MASPSNGRAGLPCAFLLLPDKNQATYVSGLQFLYNTESRKIILSNSRGDDMTNNSGRVAKVAAKRDQLRSVLSRYNSLPRDLYVRQVANILANPAYK